MVLKTILTKKYMISTALMREKPVRSPMVPPIADSRSTNLAARSCRNVLMVILLKADWVLTFLILSKVEVIIEICTNFRLLLN